MTIINNEHEIKKITVGDKIIMEAKPDDDWIPIITPDDTVTETSGLLKDLHNGTAQIVFWRLGSVKAGTILFTVPKEYKLTGMVAVDGVIRFGNSSWTTRPSDLKISEDGKSLICNVESYSNSYLYSRASREENPLSPINKCIFSVEKF